MQRGFDRLCCLGRVGGGWLDPCPACKLNCFLRDAGGGGGGGGGGPPIAAGGGAGGKGETGDMGLGAP